MGLTVLTLVAALGTRRLRIRQSRRAAERPDLSAAEFEERLGAADVSIEVVRSLHAALLPYCEGGGIRPHPDDRLASDYALDPDEMEILVEALWDELGLPKPTTREPERIPELGSVMDLALYLQRTCGGGREPDMQKPPEIRRLA